MSARHFVPSPADQERLAEISQVYMACRIAFEGLVADTDWRESPGSRAAADRLELASRIPAVPDEFLRPITDVTHWYLYAASGYLASLSVVLAAGEVLVAPAPLIRSLLENCARVVWVLGTFEQEPLDQRLARAWLEELLSAEEAKKTSARLLDESSQERDRRRAEYRAIKAGARRIFMAPHRDEHGRPMLCGQTIPRPQECVAAMLSAPNFGLDSRVAAGIYDYYANRSHPTLYHLTSIWMRRTDSQGRVTVSPIPVDSHERDAHLAVLSFYTALSYTMHYYGWPADRQLQLTEVIDRVLPDALPPS